MKFINLESNTTGELLMNLKKAVEYLEEKIINPAGEWELGKTYQKNDAVTFDGYVYLALEINTNSQPDENPDNWQIFSDTKVWQNLSLGETTTYVNACHSHVYENLTNSTVRITYELYHDGIKGSTITQPIIVRSNDQSVCVNNIQKGLSNAFTGYIYFYLYDRHRISLFYGTSIENENERPKILKVERLVENG